MIPVTCKPHIQGRIIMGVTQLADVESADITVLVDNYSDLLLPDTEVVRRLRVPPPNAPLAEHGLAYLVTVKKGNKSHTLLMDGGISGTCLTHNAALLPNSLGAMAGTVTHKIDDAETVVLSHGHFDHFCGLSAYLEKAGKPLSIVVHPNAFVDRHINMGAELQVPMPTLAEESLTGSGAVLDKRQATSTILDGMVLVTGEVERTTDFEQGSPGLEANIGGDWAADTFADDQALAVHIRGKGLLVIGGCCHAGIINTVNHIRKATGIDKIHAAMGGFHLSGPSEALIEPTVSAMKEIAPDVIVPMHCTGWKAINTFSAEMPDNFILNTVGSTYHFEK
jgi:7,8-dihydropterin-6-yl-methyl-4-(beta-D-ribofuranosyl)aminobenzene 5'-phosphate synthase